jgi:hypothetical protein
MKTRVTVIRSTDAERKRWEKAAKKEKVGVSEFLRRAGDERANNSERK